MSFDTMHNGTRSVGDFPYWKVSTKIVTLFLSSIAFALGHHLFYHSIDGIRVDRAAFGQQVNTRMVVLYVEVVLLSICGLLVECT